MKKGISLKGAGQPVLHKANVSSSFRQYGFFCSHKSDGYLWFRLLGYGLHFKNINKHPLLFSERYGYKKRLQLGGWSIRVLFPNCC
jgi:hypothetical protein